MFTTLADVLVPMSVAEFLSRMDEGLLTLLPGNGTRDFTTLLNWPMLEASLSRVPVNAIRMTRDRTIVPRVFFADGDVANAVRVARLLESGASLVASGFDRYLPSALPLATSVRQLTHQKVTTYAVATSGAGGLFKPHFDTGDSIVLQIEGTKRWQIFGPQVKHPVAGLPQGDPGTELVLDTVLSPGDVLMLPAGYWHICENGAARSLHFVLLVQPLSTVAVLNLMAAGLRQQESGRRPLVRFATPHTLAGAEAALKADLIARIEQLSLQELLDEYSKPVHDPVLPES